MTMQKEHWGFRCFCCAVGLSLLTLLNGCVPVPSSSRYYEHDMTVSVDGHRYDFKRYFECSKTLELSEADGKLHPRWNRSGAGFTTADIGSDRVLVYSITGDCESDYQNFKVSQSGSDHGAPYRTDVVRVLDNARNPQKLFVLTGEAHGFPVTIENNFTRRVDRIDGTMGMPEAELALKGIVRDSQQGFHRVTVRVIPFEVWGTTDPARDYFGKLTTVTVARVGEAPPVSGRPDEFVQFPFHRQRNYPRGVQGEIAGLRELDTAYNGETFTIDDNPLAGVQTWYATKEASAPTKLGDWPAATARYKGVVFPVKGFQEIYDPETKNILVFMNWYVQYPWGGPDPLDPLDVIKSLASPH